MARYRLTIEYEGTRYRGWQAQKNARSVQGEIQQALREILGSPQFEFQGSGRTDAGVHALRQVAHLDAQTTIPPDILLRKLNDALPPDIHILSLAKAPPRFHARHHAVSRSYLYQISTRRTAFGKRYVWWIRDSLDTDRMREAAALFSGMLDLRSFTDDDPEEKSTTILLEEVTLACAGDLILIRIRGSHFLWKLARRIVGVIAGAGRGTLSLDDIKQFLREESDVPASLTAPPSGLFLEHVLYEGDAIPGPPTPVLSITHD